ncbi:MAG: peptide-methionine (S)-S-oxide reductase MsrA [Bifidobacteriaceae bacterium]|jgi:peptide methionine sulfoxide reductase msrA/msrB|nr:peptide-methionine (S)-S-oxide reductase MsrA [Bifidobacteriaceae bacterium]MCI1914212.1 peptide-methionine (S)-S-oxide reductase MsrA [Bifidobacteriaceae bacterium]
MTGQDQGAREPHKDAKKIGGTAYFAGGCFWGLERYFQGVTGVTSTQVGYAQSSVENPSYEQVCSGYTDAVETVRVDFDPDVVSLRVLALLFMDVIDPYARNRQGNDIGRQYRSGMYFTDPQQHEVYATVLSEFREKTRRPAAVEVVALASFYEAEDYHQDYLEKNPGGYCHIPFSKIGDVAHRQKYIERIWNLDPVEYDVTQKAGTEAPFHNKYDDEYAPGIYVDIVSGEPLFVSSTKYDAGCGWPSFSKPLDTAKLQYVQDLRVPGHPRIEVRTKESGIHLGHVFDDGPAELGGQRYCMNSASLRFVPRDEMEAEGYGKYLDQVE